MLNIFPTTWPPRLCVTLGRPVSMPVDLLVTTRRMASVVLAFCGAVSRLLLSLTAMVCFTGRGRWIRTHPVMNGQLMLGVQPFIIVSEADRAMLFVPRVVRNDFDLDF